MTEISREEKRKRRRERWVAVVLALGFVIATVVQTWMANREQGYSYFGSLFYFALVYLNIIFILLFVFLVSRNLIKAYILRKSGGLGGSLRWKLVSSMILFTLVPSIVLFVGSSLVINQSFDRWFSGQVAGALKDAQTVVGVHYDGIESNLNFFSTKIAGQLIKKTPESKLSKLLTEYPIEGLELYSDRVAKPTRALARKIDQWTVPLASSQSLKRAFAGESFILIRHMEGRGDLLQRFHPFRLQGQRQVLVLSQTVPLALKTRMSDLKEAFSSYEQTRSFKDNLKTNYSLILLTIFIIVVLVVTTFALYVARNVTEPVTELMQATQAYRDGDWNYRIPTSLSARDSKLEKVGADLEILKAAFNLMGEEVGRREKKLALANDQLSSFVRELKEREQYLEILLSSIHRGVVVLDQMGKIQRINEEALEFATDSNRWSKGEPDSVLGFDWRVVFSQLGNNEESQAWLKRIQAKVPSDKIFELQKGVGRGAELSSVRATGIQLHDSHEEAIGWLLVLEDVSSTARVERLAAWQEVARRVAHEIKNPLTPIQISADRLLRRLKDNFDEGTKERKIFDECIEQIQKQVRSIRDLVREFSQFAKMPEPQFQELDLNKLLDELLSDYRFTRPDCDFHVESSIEGRALVSADPEHIRRLVVNLVDNALHSLEESKIEKPMVRVTLQSSESHQGRVLLRFEDNGPGVPESMLEKIFDPYISTKSTGLGLGLAIVRRIAVEHRGRILCEKGPGGRFLVELPLRQIQEISVSTENA